MTAPADFLTKLETLKEKDTLDLGMFLANHADEMAELVLACEQEHGTVTHYDSECPICNALTALNKEKP